MEYFDLEVTDALLVAPVTQAILIDTYKTAQGKNGEYIAGRIRRMRKSCDFKIWAGPLCDLFKTTDLQGCVVQATFKGNEFNGSRSIILSNVMKLPTGEVMVMEADPQIFDTPLNIEALYAEFTAYIQNNVTVPWVNVINAVFSSIPNINAYDRFKNERAGTIMHDGIRGGLLNHTMKMLRILETLLKNDSRLEPYAMLLRTGIILHDIGKIEEMKDGVEQHYARVSNHLIKGVCYLERCRATILENITEDELIMLESIINEHHGGLGGSADCKTIYSYIVHMTDMLDSKVTGILDRWETSSYVKGDKDKYISWDERTLYR